MGIFITGFKLNNVTKYDQRLFYAVNYGWGEVLTSGRDHGPVETHQGQGDWTDASAQPGCVPCGGEPLEGVGSLGGWEHMTKWLAS